MKSAVQLLIIAVMFLSGCTVLPHDGNDPSEVAELADVSEFQITKLESLPMKIRLLVNGHFPTPCYEPLIDQEREGNMFYVTIRQRSTLEENEGCIEMIQSFQEMVELDVYGLPAGIYTVNVNDAEKTFVFDSDNEPRP